MYAWASMLLLVGVVACPHPPPSATVFPTPLPPPPMSTAIQGLEWAILPGGTVTTHCTAVSVDTVRHLWITAGHCVEEAHAFSIEHQPATIVTLSTKVDLALLVVPTISEDALVLSTRPLLLNEHVRVIGFPFGWNYPVTTDGVVINTAVRVLMGTYLLSNVPVAPGNSGSPYLNDQNEIVGIVQIGVICEPLCGISGGTPQRILQDFLAPYLY